MAKRNLVEWMEVATGLAVLVGLVLVVMELRVNTMAVNRQAAVERASSLTEPFLYSDVLRAADEKVRAVDGSGTIGDAFIETYGMKPEQALAWSRHLMQVWSIVQADYLHGDSEAALTLAGALLTNPDNRLYVENWPLFEQTFQAEVDRLLLETASDD